MVCLLNGYVSNLMLEQRPLKVGLGRSVFFVASVNYCFSPPPHAGVKNFLSVCLVLGQSAFFISCG